MGQLQLFMLARRLARRPLVMAASLLAALSGNAALATSVTYVNLTGADGSAVRVAPPEILRLTVSGSGCRPTQYDVPPTINGQAIEFVLAFNVGCFATPPAFAWQADLPAPAPGVYEIRYFRQSSNGGLIGERTLVQKRRLIVGARPDALEWSGAGTLDRAFGNDGVAQLPGGPTNGSVVALQRSGAVIFRSSIVPNVPFARIDDSGAVDGAFPPQNAVPQPLSGYSTRMAVGADDAIWLAGISTPAIGTADRFTIRRFGANGVELPPLVVESARLSAGSGTPDSPVSVRPADLVAMPDGKFVAAGHVGGWGGSVLCGGNAFLIRFAADGIPDETFGSAGIVQAAFPGCVARVAPARNGGVWVVGTFDMLTPGAFLAKLDASGRLDASFGQGGLVFGAFARIPPVELQDGRILIGGSGFTLERLLPDGARDAAFGDRGVVVNPTPRVLTLQDLRLDAEGRAMLAGASWEGSYGGATPYRSIVLRYGTDGSLDDDFGNHGMLETQVFIYVNPGLLPIESMTLLPVPGDRWILAMNASTGTTAGNTALHVVRFRGSADPSRAPVVEFHHAGMDHYFYTSNPDEIALLDGGAGGWARTGESFNAYANATGDRADVCRFFSAAFAPKSSHLFTADAIECEAVKHYPAWTFEGIAFGSPLPDANGNCAEGTRPVFRLFNNGQGGAPAHRLVTDQITQIAMIHAGWLPEGFGDNRVAMCAPWPVAP